MTSRLSRELLGRLGNCPGLVLAASSDHRGGGANGDKLPSHLASSSLASAPTNAVDIDFHGFGDVTILTYLQRHTLVLARERRSKKV